VTLFRRQFKKSVLGPFKDYVLDLKMSSLANMLFLPKDLLRMERIELKNF